MRARERTPLTRDHKRYHPRLSRRRTISSNTAVVVAFLSHHTGMALQWRVNPKWRPRSPSVTINENVRKIHNFLVSVGSGVQSVSQKRDNKYSSTYRKCTALRVHYISPTLAIVPWPLDGVRKASLYSNRLSVGLFRYNFRLHCVSVYIAYRSQCLPSSFHSLSHRFTLLFIRD